MTVTLMCSGRQSHGPLVIDVAGDIPWTPARRPGPAHEYRCPLCGRSWRLGARRMRALGESAGRGELPGEIDLSML